MGFIPMWVCEGQTEKSLRSACRVKRSSVLFNGDIGHFFGKWPSQTGRQSPSSSCLRNEFHQNRELRCCPVRRNTHTVLLPLSLRSIFGSEPAALDASFVANEFRTVSRSLSQAGPCAAQRSFSSSPPRTRGRPWCWRWKRSEGLKGGKDTFCPVETWLFPPK